MIFIHFDSLADVFFQLDVCRIVAIERNSLLDIHLGVEMAALSVEDDCEIEIGFI